MRTGYEIKQGSEILAERFGTLPAHKPARGSQCERILAVLSDGAPHLVSEIHQRAGYSRLNSRIAELRKRGHNIESFHVGGKSGSEGYGYRLICAEESSHSPSDSSSAQESFPDAWAAFVCNVDESGGLADVYEIDPHSRKVPAA